MARYELVSGTSKKFWEITLRGKGFRVRFGRIGSDGQQQSKTFATSELARTAHDALVAEKVKKGYRPAGGRTKPSPARKSSVSALRGASSVEATCTAIERFTDRLLEGVDGLHLEPNRLAPQSASAIAQAEKKIGRPMPEDLRAFLARGLRSPLGSVGEPFATIGFAFLDAPSIATETLALRAIDATDSHASIVRRSFVLTFEEPQLLVADDGVHHFSFRNPPLVVAPSFGAFLEHWLGSGCFSSHAFPALWKLVKRLVDSPIEPRANTWVRAYQKQFPTLAK